MPEEEKKEDVQEQEEDEEKSPDLVKAANDAADRLKEETASLKKQLDRQEALQVKQTLGGHAEAGKQEQTPEEKQKEVVRQMLASTGMNPFPENG